MHKEHWQLLGLIALIVTLFVLDYLYRDDAERWLEQIGATKVNGIGM